MKSIKIGNKQLSKIIISSTIEVKFTFILYSRLSAIKIYIQLLKYIPVQK